MGMYKGCKQIFKTEDMINGFCVDYKSWEKFLEQSTLMESKNQEKEKRKIRSKKEILVKSLIVLSAIYLLCVIIANLNYGLLKNFLAACIPVILIFGIIWVHSAYSKNKR